MNVVMGVQMIEIKLLAKVLNNYNSKDKNETCLIEECGELIQAVCKLKRNKLSNLVEEVSHVMLLIEVIKIIHNIDEEEIVNECMKATSKLIREIS